MNVRDYEKLMCKGLQAPDPESGKDKEKKEDPANAVIDQGSVTVGSLDPERPDVSSPELYKEGDRGYNCTTPGVYSGGEPGKAGNEQPWVSMSKSIAVNTPWGLQHTKEIYRYGQTNIGKALVRTPYGEQFVDVTLSKGLAEPKEDEDMMRKKKEKGYDSSPEDVMNKAMGKPPKEKSCDYDEEDDKNSPEKIMKKAMMSCKSEDEDEEDLEKMYKMYDMDSDGESEMLMRGFNPSLNSRPDAPRLTQAVAKSFPFPQGVPTGSFDYSQHGVSAQNLTQKADQCGFDTYDKIVNSPWK